MDYFRARYYSSVQGRFTGVDPGVFTPADPQSWNRYSYVQNNPLKFIDPNGKDLFLKGDDADYIVSELEKYTGYKLERDKETGRVTINEKVKRNKKGTSTWLALKVNQIIGDQDAWVTVNTGRNVPGVIGDRFDKDGEKYRMLDVADYDEYKKADKQFAAAMLGHVLAEYYHAEKMASPYSDEGRLEESHQHGLEFESDVLSDFTGWWEKPREQIVVYNNQSSALVTFDYSTVAYDVVYKAGAGDDVFVAQVTKRVKVKPRVK